MVDSIADGKTSHRHLQCLSQPYTQIRPYKIYLVLHQPRNTHNLHRFCPHLSAQVIDAMNASNTKPVTRTYNTLMIACNTSGQWQEALNVYSEMVRMGHTPNTTTYNALISAHSKAGRFEKVRSEPGALCSPTGLGCALWPGHTDTAPHSVIIFPHLATRVGVRLQGAGPRARDLFHGHGLLLAKQAHLLRA